MYFGFPCQFSFHRLLHVHHYLSSGAGTIGKLVADVPSGFSLIPPQEIKKKNCETDRKEFFCSQKFQRGLSSVETRCEHWNVEINEGRTEATCCFHSLERVEARSSYVELPEHPFENEVNYFVAIFE
jgi:hypothetical protein